MSAVTIPPAEAPAAEPRVHYLNASYGVKSWLLTRVKADRVLYLPRNRLSF